MATTDFAVNDSTDPDCPIAISVGGVRHLISVAQAAAVVERLMAKITRHGSSSVELPRYARATWDFPPTSEGLGMLDANGWELVSVVNDPRVGGCWYTWHRRRD